MVARSLGALDEMLTGAEGWPDVSVSIDAYVQRLTELDGEVVEILSDLDASDRVLVTNHEVFAYFAEQYDFEVIGAIVPSITTGAEPSAASIEELAELVADEGVPAIFAETTQSTSLAEVLADEAGNDVEVVELFTESLGEDGTGAETYVDMVLTNARLVNAALGSG